MWSNKLITGRKVNFKCRFKDLYVRINNENWSKYVLAYAVMLQIFPNRLNRDHFSKYRKNISYQKLIYDNHINLEPQYS